MDDLAHEMTSTGDDRILAAARQGHPAAIRALYERHAPRVYAVVRRIAGDDALADDYAQEAWVRIFRTLPTFRGESRLSTWLYRVALNAALQEDRRRRRRDERDGPLPPVVPTEDRTRDVLLAQRLEAALDRLPPGMRRVLVLHDVEGYTHQEIGRLLEIRPGTSKSQLFKARARMRTLLRDAGLGPEEETSDNAGAVE